MMKKSKLAVILLLLSVLSANTSFGQTVYVQSALSVIKNNNLDFLEETASDLEKAMVDPSTSNDPKMWYARARIFSIIANSKDTAVQNIDNDAAMKSLNAYIEFFKNPSKKQSYVREAKGNFLYAYSAVYSKSIDFTNAKDYDKANLYLDKLKELYQYDDEELIKTNYNISKNQLDLMAYNNCLRGGKAYNKKGQKYLQNLLDNNYNDPKLYAYLAEYAMEEGDTAKAIEYINEGREIAPGNMVLITSEINIYIAMDKKKILLEKVNEGIANEPTNSQLYFIRGYLNQKFENPTEAEADYKKAVEFDPTNYDAKLNLGGLMVDRAVTTNNTELVKIDMDDYAAQDALIAKISLMYKEALVLLEDVVNNKEFTSNEVKYNLLKDIKTIYIKLKDKEKAAEYNERMQALLAD